MWYKTTVLFLAIASLVSIQDDFIYIKDDQQLKIELKNGANYLKWDELSTIKLTTLNVDPGNLSMSAPGLRMIKGATDEKPQSLWEIKPERRSMKTDTLKLNIRVKNGKDSYWSHQFKILVR